MKRPKGNYAFYLLLAVVALATVASAFFYKREADKAKRLKADVSRQRELLEGVLFGIPTEEHREFLQNQKTQVEEEFRKVVREVRRWEYLPEGTDALGFLGNMKTTIRLVLDEAKKRQVLVSPKAQDLGFGEYAMSPPRPEEDVFQLQREFSAAVDIARLLINSDVYSLDLMARGDEARMESGTSAARVFAMATESSTIKTRKKPKYDFYETVPFRVRFSCKYPSLALFLNSLLTPEGVVIGGERYPRNFLVINDLWFKVKEVEGEKEKTLAAALSRARAAAYLVTGPRGPVGVELPDDLPGAEMMLDRNREYAIWFFDQWRKWLPEQKEMYRIDYQLGQQIPQEEKEKLLAMRARLEKELSYRQLPGRPPEYSIIEVTMLIDFVQFHEKSEGTRKALVDELETGAPKPKRSVASVSTARM